MENALKKLRSRPVTIIHFIVCLGMVSPMYPIIGLQIAKAKEAQVKHSDARWIEKSNSPIIQSVTPMSNVDHFADTTAAAKGGR